MFLLSLCFESLPRQYFTRILSSVVLRSSYTGKAVQEKLYTATWYSHRASRRLLRPWSCGFCARVPVARARSAARGAPQSAVSTFRTAVERSRVTVAWH